ncbi:MAG TPA: hypothetical protein VHN77_01855 [Phycisphaerales bacterium]|nr:hypothetical protein [Phycisphaerales bacterium]
MLTSVEANNNVGDAMGDIQGDSLKMALRAPSNHTRAGVSDPEYRDYRFSSRSTSLNARRASSKSFTIDDASSLYNSVPYMRRTGDLSDWA